MNKNTDRLCWKDLNPSTEQTLLRKEKRIKMKAGRSAEQRRVI